MENFLLISIILISLAIFIIIYFFVSKMCKILNDKPKRYKALLTILLFIIVVLIFLGGIVFHKYVIVNTNAISEFNYNFHVLTDGYYEELDEDELLKNAFKNILEQLDEPYTTFLSKDYREQLSSKEVSFGIELYQDKEKNIVVKEVDDQEEKIGINDKIISINGIDCSGLSFEEFSKIYKAETQKDEITLAFKSGNGVKEVTLNKEYIEYDNITTKVYDVSSKKIGYIKMRSFTEDCDKDFKNELESLEEKGISSLIIDLRDNLGGLSDESREIIDLFIEEGKVICISQTRKGEEIVYSKTSEKRDYPIVILMNSSSASASEVMISALKNEYGATLIGTTSYGKGVGQAIMETKNYYYKYTFEKWLTSKREWIHQKGIAPDIEIRNMDSNEDSQLNSALEYLVKL